jgi:ABC-2 type transport system permease protein
MNILRDTWYITMRDLRARIRMPVFIFMSLFQPILWLVLFTQIFKSLGGMPGIGGGAVGSSYLQFFAPGVLVMMTLFGSAFAGFGMLMDMDTGVLSKMLATPVTRVSVIIGRVLASTIVILVQSLIIVIVSLIMGVQMKTGAAGVVFAFFLLSLLGLGFAAFSNGLALLLKRQENVMAVTNLLTMPLMFLSSLMMPAALLPGWLNTVRQINPIDYAVVGARDLISNGYIWHDLWLSLVVLAALAVVGVAFGTLMFRTRAE